MKKKENTSKNIVDVSIRMTPDYDFALIVYPEKNGVHDGRLVMNYTPDKWDEVVKDVAGPDGDLNIVWYAFALSTSTDLAFRVRNLDDVEPFMFEYYDSTGYLELSKQEFESILKTVYTNASNLRDSIGGNEYIANSAYFQDLLSRFHSVPKVEYKEAFSYSVTGLQALIFSNIDIGDMIDDLGYKRIAVDGIEVNRRVYNPDGSYTMTKKHNVYEILEVNTSKLLSGSESSRARRADTTGYVVKCWCTTTGNPHYIWIHEDFAKDKDPLKAIASTFHVQKSLIPHIKELKRQGDILFAVYTDPSYLDKVDPNEEKVPLTPEQYFGLLVAET